MKILKIIDKSKARERRDRLIKNASEADLSLTDGVREMRAISGMTQEEFAEHRGISTRALKALELGQGNPTISTLNRIAEFYGLEVGFVPIKKNQVADEEFSFDPKFYFAFDNNISKNINAEKSQSHSLNEIWAKLNSDNLTRENITKEIITPSLLKQHLSAVNVLNKKWEKVETLSEQLKNFERTMNEMKEFEKTWHHIRPNSDNNIAELVKTLDLFTKNSNENIVEVSKRLGLSNSGAPTSELGTESVAEKTEQLTKNSVSTTAKSSAKKS